MPLTTNEPPRIWDLDEITVTEPATIRRAITAASIGNVTEWYDFGVYAYFEPVISRVFFAGLDHAVATIAAFGLFAIAFLVRPFGGMFFGPLADRIGRTRVLAITMILMALGTFAIGCIPDPAAIGMLAPLFLLLARLVQGFSTGGEYGSAMTFIAEYAPDRRRGYLGSWLEFGTFAGYLLGAATVTLVSAALSPEDLVSWGWRLPFFVALPLGFVGIYLRMRLGDTPAFRQMQEDAARVQKERKGRHEFRDVLRLWPFMLVCTGLVVAWNVTNYMLTSYMPTYVSDTLPAMGDDGISSGASQVIQIVVMAVALVTIPLLGKLSDRIGRKPVAMAGAIGLVVLALPMILLIRSETPVTVFLGLLMMGLLLICFSATMPSTLPSLFPTHVRAGGLSIAFNVAISLFCGTTSLAVGTLVSATGDLNWPAYYLIAAGVVGIISLILLNEPNGQRMWGSAPSAVDHEEALLIYAGQGGGEPGHLSRT